MNFYYFGEYEVIHNKMRITFSKHDNWVNRYADIHGQYDNDYNYLRIYHYNYLKYADRYQIPVGWWPPQPISNFD